MTLIDVPFNTLGSLAISNIVQGKAGKCKEHGEYHIIIIVNILSWEPPNMKIYRAEFIFNKP